MERGHCRSLTSGDVRPVSLWGHFRIVTPNGVAFCPFSHLRICRNSPLDSAPAPYSPLPSSFLASALTRLFPASFDAQGLCVATEVRGLGQVNA